MRLSHSFSPSIPPVHRSSFIRFVPFITPGSVCSLLHISVCLCVCSWSEFFDFNNFSSPPSPSSEAVARINVNLTYYWWNYLIFIALAALYTTFNRPLFTLALAFTTCTALYLFSPRRPALLIAGRQFSRQEIFVCWCATSLIACIWSGGLHFAVSTLLALVVVLVHAALRQRTMKAKVVSFLAFLRQVKGEEGEGEDDSVDGGSDPEMGRGRLATGGGDREQEILKNEQAKFRSNFRASMRAKYLKEGGGQ